MKRIDVVKRGTGWVGHTADGTVISRGTTKAEAVQRTAKFAHKDTQPVTVKIHKVDGKIQEERTYPRSADSRRSRG